ncbi:hypothetical protein [Pedobacter insulae]|uniref:Uncharacterized protein n=1 Tax=Pedobacter insulae TaxID=414048 RepID=A0A1I2VP91_9SPHI|nr:hypothetical protein [Pedobacter insulae]SFG89346.1 hypothetical protein SAMN04489864_10375 [Pedobacter insulae]
MATLKTTTAANWIAANEKAPSNDSAWKKYLAFVDGQKNNSTLWFLISLSIHAAILLPLPLILIGFFNAPISFLVITMFCFFTNFVANMGGSGIRTTFTCFLFSLLIHIGMIFWVVAS